MKKLIAGTALSAASLAFATGAFAIGPPYLQVIAPPDVLATQVDPCQTAVGKNTQKYVKSLTKIRSKCLADSAGEFAFDACPNADDNSKAQNAGVKAVEKIADECVSTTGLATTYNGATASNVANCTLGQVHAAVELYLGETNGIPGSPNARDCQVSIDKASQKLLPALIKASNKCIETYLKIVPAPAGIGAKCAGSMNLSNIVQPTDVPTNDSFNKSIVKAWDTIGKECTGLDLSEYKSLYGCPGATSLDDLEQCVEATAIAALLEIVDNEYGEDGTLVTPGTNAIQTAVNNGDPGEKFLIGSGTYAEGIVLPQGVCSISAVPCGGNKICSSVSKHPGDPCTADSDCYGTCSAGSPDPGATCTVNGDCSPGTCQVGSCVDACTGGGGDTCISEADNMQFVGCGAATNQRPVIRPPASSPPNQGIQASGIDGLTFQGLEVHGWATDGIHVSGADGVTFSDILGNGEDLSTSNDDADAKSTYAIFPVKSSNVLVQTSEVTHVKDAGIYVGQSHDIIMRHNYVHDCVSGMELENSMDGTVYGNVTTGNTGGLLVFKLPDPEHQVSGDHFVFENLSYSNNVANFCYEDTTVCAVPRGTGLMVISDNDSVYYNNYVARNDSYGILVLDQNAINALAGDIFDPTSYYQDSTNLQFLDNVTPSPVANKNGGNADMTCQGGADAHEACTSNNQCDNQICAATFPGNWVWAITTDPAGTCWSPEPTPVASAVLGNDSFPACP